MRNQDIMGFENIMISTCLVNLENLVKLHNWVRGRFVTQSIL